MPYDALKETGLRKTETVVEPYEDIERHSAGHGQNQRKQRKVNENEERDARGHAMGQEPCEEHRNRQARTHHAGHWIHRRPTAAVLGSAGACGQRMVRDRLDLKLTESVEFPEMIACMERVVDEWRKAALEHAAESGEEPHLLVVTKSLSTLSYPHSAKLGLRVVLLTPVLNPPPFDKHKSVIPAPLPGTAGSPMPLICAGDADPYYDDAKAHLLTDHVRTYAGANHSIEVPDDWQTSLDYLKQVTQAIVDYAG